MKRVPITGGTGFVGANLVYTFFEMGYEVHLMVRKISNFWRIEGIRQHLQLHDIDLLDSQVVTDFIEDLRPNIILHLATYGAYQGKQQDIQTTIQTNVTATINLLEACKGIDFECFINTGSNSEYGEKNEPMREDAIAQPNNLYGITKLTATLYAQLLTKKYSLPIVTTRLFAVYGYWEEKERLVPSVVKSYLTNVAPQPSTPTSVRDFIFIEDVVDAYVHIIKNITAVQGEVLNIGKGKQYSVGDIVEIVQKITQSNIEPVYGALAKKQLEPTQWVADMSKMNQKLGWSASHSLEDGLKKSVTWFSEHISLYS